MRSLPPRVPRAAAADLAGAFLVALAVAGYRLRATGAIPVEEFGPAPVLYASLPVLLGLGAATILAATAVASRRPRGLLLAPGAILTLAAPLLPPLLPAGVALLVVATVLLHRSGPRNRTGPVEAAAAAISRPRPGGVLRTFLVAAALGTVVAGGLGLVETGFRTARFCPALFPPEVLGAARRAILAWAGIAGLLFGAIVAGAVLAFGLLLALLGRLRPRDPELVCFAGTFLAGCGAAVTVLLLIRGAFGDEIDALGLAGTVLSVAAILAVAAHAHLWGHLTRAGFAGADGEAIRSPGDFALALAAYALLPPAPLLPRAVNEKLRTSRSAATVALLAVGTLVLLPLRAGLYPRVEDYREKGFSFYAAAGLLVTLCLCLGLVARWLPRRRAGRPALLLAAATPVVAILLGAGPLRRPDVRLVLFEYTRFGPLAADYLPDAPFRPFPRLGTADPGRRFSFHGPGEDRLPPRPPELAGRPARPPILLIVWDAVRPDHLSAFGDPRETTPTLDRLAKQSVIFTRAHSASTATTCGVRCFLSGRYATRYMLSKHHPPFFVRELAQAGYRHFLVTVMGTDYNGVSAASFTRGWDPEAAGAEFTFLDIPNDDNGETDPPKVRRVLSILSDRAKAGPAALDGTFVYLHLIGGHLPWKSEEFGNGPADRYDGEIEKLDALTGKLLSRLKELGVFDRMVIVLLADHGTGLGEHGRVGGFLSYEEQIRVPLLIRIPGLPPRRVTDLVSLVDLAPTLVGLVSPGRDNPYHGRSLMPLMTGGSLPPRPIFNLCAFNDAYAVIDGAGRYKLWHHRGRGYEALFDLATDPGEARNLDLSDPAEASGLRTLLDEFLWQGRGAWASPWHYRAPR